MKYPIKHGNQTLEDKSRAYFMQHVPPEWNVNHVEKDFGHDLSIEISQEGQFQGLELIVQLKSSHEPNRDADNEKNTLRVATYNYLWNNLRVVLLVKYVESENEAYWVLLRNVPPPNQEQESFTVNFPLANKLSKIDWDYISLYVLQVHLKKIKANR